MKEHIWDYCSLTGTDMEEGCAHDLYNQDNCNNTAWEKEEELVQQDDCY